jgi:hypothetical protein
VNSFFELLGNTLGDVITELDLPEIRAWWAVNKGSIMLDLYEADDSIARLGRVRELHIRNTRDEGAYCDACQRFEPGYALRWPCETILAINGEETK